MAIPKWNAKRRLWIIQGQKNGIKKSFYSSVPGLKGKKEVYEKYNDWLDFGGIDGKISVERCVELYLKDIEARLGRGTVYRTAETYSRLYIVPALGKCKMNNLTLRDCQTLINKAKPQKDHNGVLSRKTLSTFRGVIASLHKFAYINYYCDAWRGTLYIPQGHPKGEKEILQPKNIADLMESSGEWYGNAFKIMLLCGLRVSECLGLWEDDIKGDVLYIRRGVTDDGRISEGKTKAARRVVPLPPLAREIIAETIKRNHRANFGTPWIFPNGSGGKPNQNTMRVQWRRLKKKYGLPGTPYSLRHTFISIVSSQTSLAEGTIRELVGHSSNMDTFGTYKHKVKGELENAAQIINLTFERLKAEND